ncbi:hypothetical protein HU200_010880 [Digitaria exilis]|uniref:Uncharacterized protein n=1 Tax=Digitaria exilis TaxID=1010633 RepID=A0A835FI02_9POAL|nr:hypothetical protein HU200_010880 [Digitaria exilis]
MAVEELPPYRVRDLMHVGRDGHDAMSKMMARAVAAVNLSSGLVLNTLDALERRELEGLRRDLAVPVFDVGPLHKLSPAAGDNSSRLLCQDRSCLEWLDAWPPSSVLYVSFGSLACMTPRDMVETAWGIAGSGVSFIWVVRPGLVRGCAHDADQLPVGFEAATRQRGMVVAWAPQEEVLRHRGVGGFWTHNGWNSTMESVVEGVPMLCRPIFGDQMGNARGGGHGSEHEVEPSTLPTYTQTLDRSRGSTTPFIVVPGQSRPTAQSHGFIIYSDRRCPCAELPQRTRNGIHRAIQLLYSRWIGFEVDGELERGKVEAAIRRLMTDRDGVEMRARAGELKKAAAECTGKGGMSCLAIDKMAKDLD